MSARRESRSSAPQLPVRTTEQLKVGFRKSDSDSFDADAVRSSDSDGNEVTESDRLAAHLLDEAFKDARMRNQDIADLCGVSESMVIKWRSPDSKRSPSFPQMLRLPLSFKWALHKQMNAHFGFGTTALRELLDAAGILAAGMK